MVSASPKILVEGGLRRAQLASLVDSIVAGEDTDEVRCVSSGMIPFPLRFSLSLAYFDRLEHTQGSYPAFSGKVALLRDVFQQPPMLVVGDSFGDFQLLEACKGLSIVLLNHFNPSLEVRHNDTRGYAQNVWLIFISLRLHLE